MRSLSAFQGAGWRPRSATLPEEIAARDAIWAPWRVNSEYRRLEAVLLFRPGREMGRIKDPNSVQHLARVKPLELQREIDRLTAVFRRLGVKVFFIRPDFSKWPVKQNLVFVRDLFLNTPGGAVVSRMASEVRAGEEKHAAAALADLAVPINRTISGDGRFEAADALWLDEKTVVCGVGNRTSRNGFGQLRQSLEPLGIDAIAVPMPGGIQHLLGILQIVDARLAFVRTEIAPRQILAVLKKKRYTVIAVKESPEVRERQGLNFVTVAPRKLVMAAGCPGLKRTYSRAGMTVLAELEIPQLRNAAGGLACAVGILSRRT